MKILQEKSDCCAAAIIRYGGKRRQCTHCRKTWRVHVSKRGRKQKRKQWHYLRNVFRHGMRIKQLSLHSLLSYATIYKRFAKNLEAAICKKRVVRVIGKKLILLIDAEWQYFSDDLWTLYFLSVKAVGSESVTIFDPILRCGKENASVWNELIEQLPTGIKKRIIAMVSDGIRGIESIAADRSWVLQRCHFHLLGHLQKMRGKRTSTPGRVIREKIYNSVAQALKETDHRRLEALCKRLSVLVQHSKCPRAMRMAVNEFLRRIDEFRNYLRYPKMKLPTTINVMESINSFVRKKSLTTRTPQSWRKWAIACVRFKSKFTCK